MRVEWIFWFCTHNSIHWTISLDSWDVDFMWKGLIGLCGHNCKYVLEVTVALVVWVELIFHVE